MKKKRVEITTIKSNKYYMFDTFHFFFKIFLAIYLNQKTIADVNSSDFIILIILVFVFFFFNVFVAVNPFKPLSSTPKKQKKILVYGTKTL